MNLLTNENPLILLPQLACVIGPEEAIVLQQLHFRLQQQTVTHDGEVWYCQSLAKWQKQLPFWNEPKIKRLIRTLEDLQVVHSTDRLNQFYVDRTKWYKIDYDKLQELLNHYEQSNCPEKMAQLSLPQTKPVQKKKQSQGDAFTQQIDEVLNYLNDKATKRFSLKSQANRNFLRGRFKEGYTVSDCKAVIDEQIACWKDNEMEKYLRPMTLFRPANFESYLNNALSKQPKTSVPKAVVLNFSAGEDL